MKQKVITRAANGNTATDGTEQVTSKPVTIKMSYNKGDQLTAMQSGKDKLAYSYDQNGNMVQKVLSSKEYGKLTDTYAYNAQDMITVYVGYDGYEASLYL